MEHGGESCYSLSRDFWNPTPMDCSVRRKQQRPMFDLSVLRMHLLQGTSTELKMIRCTVHHLIRLQHSARLPVLHEEEDWA